MESSVWEMGKNKIGSADTFFTSEFFDLNNDTSQIEDFDISKQYLNSELSQKSTILRRMSEEYFLKAIEVHFKFCLIDSLSKKIDSIVFWRKINEKEKRKQALSPKNMTKVFIKMFYILNKKIRSKLQKSFVKITNFTKLHDMKTYETPMVIGLKKLTETLETLKLKYCYGNPVYLQHLKQRGFYELKLFEKIFKNKEKLISFGTLIKKMSDHIALQQFGKKLNSYQKLSEKLEIFFGTLSLLINPTKRYFFQKIKEGIKSFNCILNELDESAKDIEPQSLTKDFSIITNKQITQNSEVVSKRKTNQISKEVEICPLVQELGSKKSSQSSNSEYFNHLTQSPRLQSNQISEQKNSLKFSKELKRKSPGLEKKDKFKFKSIPAGTPKKTTQSAYIQNNLQVKPNIQISDSEKLAHHKDRSDKTTIHKPKFNLGFMYLNSRAFRLKMAFENSLNYGVKSSRIISNNEKIIFTNSHKPQQLTTSYPDYFDFYAFTEIPFDKKLREAQKASKSKDQNKKGFTIFKTIKSGKSFSNLDEFPNATPMKQYSGNNQLKFLQKAPQTQTPANKFVENFDFQRKKFETLHNSNSNQKIVNFKSLERVASNSSLHSLKHDYRFPVAYKSNKNSQALPHYDSVKLKTEFYSEYNSNPYQKQVDPNMRQQRIEKAGDSSKNSQLTFKTNRPMKKVKSSDKEIVIKNIQGKRDRKGEKSSTKVKRPKEIKSEFIDQKQQIPNPYYKTQNSTMLSARSAKSVSQKCLHKNIGLKLNSKK